uniref:Vacuolar protein sorting 13 homolog A n=1 Tax=Cyprinus carpio TaxID=7962 RepID=A0A8C2BZK7_CYPCA
MVFESVVVDVLNRFLGDYVVNLDSSQLSLGIWGGDAILRNLAIKENALSQLDIPFKVRAGHIGRLELKIPWKNLYTQSVEATLDEVFLLIVPTASIKYDSEKEERQLQEAQQRELQRIEETKQKANPKAEKQDTFVEKLVTQVIKNLQVKISNIHVRYEDDVSTLDTDVLELRTADQNWMPCLLDEQAKLFFKVKTCLFHFHHYEQQNEPLLFTCFFRPISANAKLRMNPRSDVDFSSPKVDLVVNLPEVAVELSRPQYVSILELLGSVDMMTRNLPYRKYRPDVAVHTNARQWWRYVITGVLEVNVKPRLHMWSWQRIRHHRQHVKKYRELYKNKITSKKPAESLLKELEVNIPHHLFLIDLLTFCSYLSGFDELMSPAEKAKLYAAIGYSETAVNPNLPKNFENMKILFQLNHLSLSIKESPEKPEIIKLSVIDLKAMLTQRPAAQAIKISAQLSSFEVSGLPRGKSAPILLSPRHVLGMNDTALLDLMFETNPLDASADQRLRIESQALEIIYDAMTVNSMSDFFMPPKDLQLDELTNATLMKLEQFRDKTSTGLMYIIETQKVLDLKINLMASYVIVPENGFYDPKHNLAILDLGHFQVKSSHCQSDLPQLSVGSSTIEDIMSRAYDSFDIQLNSLQFLYTKAGGDWKRARPLRQSAFHILEPVDLKVVFSRAMVVTDSRMPKFKMYGELPLLSLCISDDKVRGVLALLTSIPLPESRPAPQTRGPQVTPKVIKRMFMGVSSQTNIDMIVVVVHNCSSADKNAPDFKTMYKNTEQLIKVNFSSLDVHMHTEALLNSINFLNNLLPPLKKEAQEEQPVLAKEEKEEEEEAKIEDSAVTKKSCKKINFAVSIAGKEVFDFRMVNHVAATEGDAYTDMHIVDTSVTLTVGCIQVIFLNKFMSSILAFINNFQEAKNALAEVTAQAAEKAASGVLELAERSTRISLDVDIKAPVVFLPQSSVSNNVIVADLGLVTVKNHFEMVSSPAHNKIPPVMDIMAVGLSDLKMYRLVCELQLLKPVNMDLSIKRNLSASWYHSIPDIQINAHLKPMMVRMHDQKKKKKKKKKCTISISSDSACAYRYAVGDVAANTNVHLLQLILSQEDLTIVLKTLSENLSESSDAPSSSDKGDTVSIKDSQSSGGIKHTQIQIVKLVFCIYVQIQLSDSRDESLKLAEFMLGTISTAVHMFSDSSMKASLKLTNCLLDDKRQSVKMITSRMMAMRQGREGDVMVDMSYRKGRDGTVLDTLVQDLYLCASMEFLLTVANVFLKAMADGFSGPPKNKQPFLLKQYFEQEIQIGKANNMAAKTEMNIVVKNPEIVFVADLTRADAPALIMTTQCELVMKNEPSGQSMTAAISDLKVVACPLLREKREHNVTTVLQPCQVFFQSSQSPSQPQSIELSISSLTLKVSPIIINTIITIQSALIPAAETPEELESPVPQDLWERRNLRDLKLWFLEEEEENVTRSVIRLVPNGESLKMNIDSICLTLEAGVGHRTVPMLLAKASFKGDVKNWSTLINLHCHLDLEVNYYNEMMGLWEPLLEPLDDEEKDCQEMMLCLQMKKKPVSYSEISDEVDGSVPDYKTVISFTSKDQLNITLSKCGIYMLSNLGTAFAEATKQTAECFQKDQAPFVVKNRLGLPVAVLHSEVFRPIGKESKNRVVELQDGENLNMDYTHTAESSDQFSAMTSLSAKNYIQPIGHTSASVIPLIKTGRDMHSVMHHDSGVTRFFVCQIYTIEGSKYVKIRSPFQVDLLKTFYFFSRAELSLQPVTEGEEQYDRSEGFAYTEVNQKPGECLVKTCHHHEDSARMLKVNMVPVPDTLMSHSTEEEYDKPIILHLWPTVLLRNLLPYPITFKIKGNGDFPSSLLKAGHSSQIHTAIMDFSTLELKLLGYLQQDWESKYSLCSDADEISFIRFCSLGEDEETEERPELNIAVHVKKEEGQLVVAIHSPYWMVNKTGRLLQYKADDVHHKHQKDYDMPLLFSFKPCNFLQNNKIRLMISESELSDDFSIDTVGSYGDVKCKGGQKDFMVKVLSLQPSDLNTSKLTLFSFLILYFLLSYWYTFSPKTVYRGNGPLFKKLTGEMYNILYEIYRNGICVFWLKESICLFIYFFSNLICLFPLKCVGINLKNAEMDELAPGQAVYYTWAEPTGSRILSWKWGKYKGELKSEEGKFFVVSFYEGLQRVALFTTEHCVFKKICDSEKMELAEQETCISLQNMGISLVNNSSSHEVAFVGITSSDVVWETKPKKRSRWKVLSVKETAMLEQRYREYMESGPVDSIIIDLENNYQVSAHRNQFTPRSELFNDCDAFIIVSEHEMPLVTPQIQNQLPGAIFPFVFYPVKPPKSVSMDSEPKPLADVSIITRVAGHSDILRIKYFKVLIQEMDLRIDLGFLYALLELLTAEHASALFEKDIEYLKTELNHSSATDTSPISLYEYFHISPIKLHLSFSLSSGGEDGNKIERETGVILVQSLNLLLKSIGATLTDAQDVLFKLAFCELRYQFRTTQQLQSEVVRHYSKQVTFHLYHSLLLLISQMYVLVLGLDVLGNPFGLIRGLSQGVEAFFYEPYQGAIQGPEEFVEGMALGVKALVGGAVGGLAGAASRITGAMAKGVAAMTMDEEYQQKRREAMNKQPSGLREGLSRGGKGLVSGFVSGITGIVTKPIKGAQKEGAAGFFKGMGKGLVGVLTRPTGGIIDMASSTFQGIRRAAETSQNVESLRPPRFIHEDGVIRPYKEREGIGSQMLQVTHDTSLPAITLLVFKIMALKCFKDK